MRKVIPSMSISRERYPWPPARVAHGDLAAEIAAIKEEPGPDVIAWGSATFSAALAADALTDEYRAEGR
jgi:hypothetical protein